MHMPCVQTVEATVITNLYLFNSEMGLQYIAASFSPTISTSISRPSFQLPCTIKSNCMVNER